MASKFRVTDDQIKVSLYSWIEKLNNGETTDISLLTQLINMFADGTAKIEATLNASSISIDQSTPGSTNAVSLSHLGSTAIAANSGTNSNGTQRVTIATDDSLNVKLGEVQESPTANTILARLKDVNTTLNTQSFNRKVASTALLSSPQTLTVSFADLGSEIDCIGYNTLGVWVKLTANQSTGIQLKALAKHTSAGTDEYSLPISIVSSTLISLNPEIVQFPDANGLYLLQIELNNVVPYIQLQCKMTTDGGTDGTIDSVYITKGY